MHSGTEPNPSLDRRPTLRDVAKATGFHATTVSKALRDHPTIPEATRRRIREIAASMGYERNPVYYALSRFRREGDVSVPTPRIAFLENTSPSSGFTRQSYMDALVEGARSQARLLGYELDELTVGEDGHDSRSLMQYLRDHRIAGVVLSSFQPGFAETALNWDELAVAKINSRHTEPEATVVGNDQLREVRLAFRRLRELGYRRIGLAVGRSDEDACGHRHTAGYLMETTEMPAADRVPPLLFPYNMTEGNLSAMLARWARRHAVDVVLCNWVNIGDMLRRAGLKAPQDIAYASLCLCDPVEPGLAGVRPQFQVIGERAISIVVTQLKGGERGLPEHPSSTYVQSLWQDGPSAPPRHA